MPKKSLFHLIKDWEHWPFALFYFPLSFVWAWYCLKSRSLWFFSSSNPTIAFGGMEGESKSEMYSQLPQELYPSCIYINPATSFTIVIEQVNNLPFSYPFIVKPNVGMAGLLVRKIENEQQLCSYHRQMPAEYIVQQYVDLPVEVSVFYYRHPAHATGVISAFIQKNLLTITGDGSTTLQELILKHPEAAQFTEAINKQHSQNLSIILGKGEQLQLSTIANRYNGSTFINLSNNINNTLLQVFDAISHTAQFYYGRYDIKCASANSMARGNNFIILEFNGAGSIPNHIYTNTYTLWGAYAEIVKHWKALYQISRYNHQAGHPYWKFGKGYHYLKKAKQHFKILKACDKTINIHSQA